MRSPYCLTVFCIAACPLLCITTASFLPSTIVIASWRKDTPSVVCGARVCMQKQVHACTCGSHGLSPPLSTLLLRQELHRTHCRITTLATLAGLPPLLLGLRCLLPYSGFMWVLGTQTQALLFAQWVLYQQNISPAFYLLSFVTICMVLTNMLLV